MNLNFTMIAQAIAFAILIWFTVKFVWPPLLNAIEKRQKEIADGLAAAQEGKLSLEVAAKKNAETLNEVKQKDIESKYIQKKKKGNTWIQKKSDKQKKNGIKSFLKLKFLYQLIDLIIQSILHL